MTVIGIVIRWCYTSFNDNQPPIKEDLTNFVKDNLLTNKKIIWLSRAFTGNINISICRFVAENTIYTSRCLIIYITQYTKFCNVKGSDWRIVRTGNFSVEPLLNLSAYTNFLKNEKKKCKSLMFESRPQLWLRIRW